MKVVVLMGALNMGGAERVATSLVNFMANKNIETYLISFDNKNCSYVVNDNVNFIINHNKVTGNKIKGIKQRIKFMMDTLNQIKPNLIFTMFYDITMYAILYKWFSSNRNVKLVSSERCHPKSKDRNGISKILNWFASRNCNGYIFQTERARSFYSKKVQKNSTVIHNPIGNPLIKNIEDNILRTENTITSMGRLEYQKAHDVMIKAFSNIANKYPEYKLVIYGEGSQRQELQNLINELNIKNNVSLPGNSEHAIFEVAKSQIFLLTSRFEGMPNALIEAMAIGVPCVSTDCEMGPAELIEDGINGFLVPVDDEVKITEVLLSLIENQQLRDKISLECKKINETHSEEYIFTKYIEYFKQVIGGNYEVTNI